LEDRRIAKTGDGTISFIWLTSCNKNIQFLPSSEKFIYFLLRSETRWTVIARRLKFLCWFIQKHWQGQCCLVFPRNVLCNRIILDI